MKTKKKHVLPMNIQFFAEQDTDPSPEQPTQEPDLNQQPTPSPQPEPNPEPQETAEQIIARLTAQNAAYKKATDAATKDASTWKKKYNSTLSEQERLANEKAEELVKKEQRLQELERENAINKMSKSFIALGYSEEQALKASESQIDGEIETFLKILKEHDDSIKNNAVADYMKKMNIPPSGNVNQKDSIAMNFASSIAKEVTNLKESENILSKYR